jgi:hypothetical protein
MLAYGMQSPKTVVGLWSIKIDGHLKTRDNVPLEYWETCDARQGGIIVHVNEGGLCIRSLADMYIGGELRISVFFSLGREFDGFQALVRIIGKDLCCEEGCESYEYELEFVRIAEEDRLKLRNFLRVRQAKNIYS